MDFMNDCVCEARRNAGAQRTHHHGVDLVIEEYEKKRSAI
jgi:hypothetical protein